MTKILKEYYGLTTSNAQLLELFERVSNGENSQTAIVDFLNKNNKRIAELKQIVYEKQKEYRLNKEN